MYLSSFLHLPVSPCPPEVASTLASLGGAYGALGDAARKRDLLERALAIELREFGPEHREVAVTLTSLGNACAGGEARVTEMSGLRSAFNGVHSVRSVFTALYSVTRFFLTGYSTEVLYSSI